MFRFINNLLAKVLIQIIKIYQKTLSLDHGVLKFLRPYGQCRFRPTCSEYTIQALKKYGLFKGSLLGAWRIIRSNPFSKGGYDPLK